MEKAACLGRRNVLHLFASEGVFLHSDHKTGLRAQPVPGLSTNTAGGWAGSSGLRGWGTGSPHRMWWGGGLLPAEARCPTAGPQQVKQTTEEEGKQPVCSSCLLGNGMGRSAQLTLPDVEPKHRQLLTVYQPELNSSSTRARPVQ